MGKRGFIRAVWGTFDPSHRITRRRRQINKDVKRILNNSFNEDFRTYVFGEDNYKGLIKNGVKDVVLVDVNPTPFDAIKHQYRNKLEIIRYAMEEDGYDEMIYMDWDCVPQKKLPVNFWDEMGKKEIFQANLQIYHRRKCHWRKKELRKVPNGGFVYLRDKTLPAKAICYWEKLRGDNDEPAWAKMTDDMVGGWQGPEKYWELFEPMFCDLHRSSPFKPEQLKQKNVCFIHYQG